MAICRRWFDRFPAADATVQRGLYKMGERYYDPRGNGRAGPSATRSTRNADLRQSNRYMYVGGDLIDLPVHPGLTGTYWDVDAGPFGDSASRNCTGAQSWREESGSVSISIGSGGGMSAGEYTGEYDGHKVTVQGQACALYASVSTRTRVRASGSDPRSARASDSRWARP